MIPQYQGAHDLWIIEKEILTNKFFFVYKFAIYDSNNEFIKYERGVDRIVDCEILADETDTKKNIKSYMMADQNSCALGCIWPLGAAGCYQRLLLMLRNRCVRTRTIMLSKSPAVHIRCPQLLMCKQLG